MESLFLQWRTDVAILSSFESALGCASTQAILAQGRTMVPFLVSRIEEHPAFIGELLVLLSGECQVPLPLAGRTDAIVEAWKGWTGAEERGKK